MIFHKTNQFVLVSHNYNKLIHGLLERELKSMGLKDIFEQRGFPILAIDETARDFKHYAMELRVGGMRIETSGQSWEPLHWRRRHVFQMFMIACDDLEHFCSVVLYINHFLRIPDGYSTSTRIYMCLSVHIIARNYQNPVLSKNDTAIQSSIQRLLEPLRRLHGIDPMKIEGPISETYRENIKRSIVRKAPTADEMITTACALKTKGDDALHSADFWSSVYAYEKAISEIEAVCQPDHGSAIVKEGTYSGWSNLDALQHLHHKLQLDIVSAFVLLHEYQRAHNWSMVELWSRTGFEWNTGAVSDDEVAELWYLKAQASKGLGKTERAHNELELALVLAPDSKDIAAEFGNLTLQALRTLKATMRWRPSLRR